MLLYKFIFISDLNLIPMFSVFLFFLNISVVYLSETDDPLPWFRALSEKFQNLECPDWLKTHFTV